MSDESFEAGLAPAKLRTNIIGREVRYYPSLSSTMLAAKEEARQGAAEGLVVIAGEQTAGRGRRERVWLSPEGGVALSVLLRPSLAGLPSMIMLASLAVVRSIAAETGLAPRIKWPNDVLIGEKKVCGILIENELRGAKVEWSIIGIGINANIRMADYPEIESISTSLSGELRRDVSRVGLVRSMLVEMDSLYMSLKAGGSLFEAWRDNLATLGRRVRVISGGGTLEGTAVSVEPDGALILRQPDDTLSRVVAGEVSLRH